MTRELRPAANNPTRPPDGTQQQANYNSMEPALDLNPTALPTLTYRDRAWPTGPRSMGRIKLPSSEHRKKTVVSSEARLVVFKGEQVLGGQVEIGISS